MALVTRYVNAGQPFSVTYDHDVTWQPENRDKQTGRTMSVTYQEPRTKPRFIRVTSGDDINLVVLPKGAKLPASEAPKPPPPVIDVGPSSPSGTVVSNDDQLRAAAPKGGNILLPRGGEFRPKTLKATKGGTKFFAAGDSSKPLPIIRAEIIIDEDVAGVEFDGIDLNGEGINGVGLFAYQSGGNIRFANGRIRNYGSFGVEIVGDAKKHTNGITIENTLIANNAIGDKASGIHLIECYGWAFRGCVFNTNGWIPGKSASSIYNHGAYIRANNGPGDFEDCVFYNNSSHGAQMRSGGNYRRCLSLDNPIGLSYGYVNGNPVHDGGVSGEVVDSVFIGGRDIAGSKRGWAIELGNIKSAIVKNILIANDNQHNAPAIIVRKCEQVEGAAKDVGVMSLSLDTIYVWDWRKGPIEVKDGLQVMQYRVGITPPKQADLRDALGSTFMDGARKNPGGAAKYGIDACRKACGL